MNIVLTFNYHNKEKYGIVSDEFDTPETIESIKTAIEKEGHKVYLIEADENFYLELKKLKDARQVDLLFNYSVGIYSRSRETHIPAMCEMLQIPYSSSDVLSTALCQDKARTKELLLYHGIPTSPFQVFRNPNEKYFGNLQFPVIIKYAYQGTSIGLSDEKAVVNNENELIQRVRELYAIFPQAIIAEEYVKGREFTMGFYGNEPNLNLFPVVEIKPLDTQSVENWIFNSREQPISTDLDIEDPLKNKIEALSWEIIRTFELRDWGRIDMRLDEHDNEIKILEINNCAHLSKKSVYFEGAKAFGLDHKTLIKNMLNAVLSRYQLI